MGKITRADAIKTLRKMNPDAPLDRIHIYTDALITYQEANENIERNGAVSAHPRTGSPMENPYLKVRAAAAATMLKIDLESGKLWE